MSQIISFVKNGNTPGQLDQVKIGVISDTHIADPRQHLPPAVLCAFKQVDLIVHLGDIVSLRVIEELRSICPQVMVVAGNMDQEEVRKKYPQKQILEILGYKIGLMHGAGPAGGLPELLSQAFSQDNCDLIIFGHSHKPMNERIGSVLFFNPGSATDLCAAYNSYGIIELKKKVSLPKPPGQGREGIEAKIIRI